MTIVLILIVLINLHPSHIPWYKKVNPVWWLLNDDDPINQKKYDKRYPGKPHWYRVVRHAWRNPAANFFRYVVGFKDKRSWLRGHDMWPYHSKFVITLPWVSFRAFGFEGYAGWNVGHEPEGMNYGALTFCFRRQ